MTATTFNDKLMARLTPGVRLALILVLLSLPLLQMVWRGEDLLVNGTKIVLRTQPVDPRSLFQGDYVILSYDISRIDRDKLRGRDSDGKIDQDKQVYVVMRPTAPNMPWELVRASLEAPSLNKGEIMLKGRTRSASAPGGSLSIAYGLEQFFVTENTGYELERIRNQDSKRMTVEVSVLASGEARLNRLLVDGQTNFLPSGLN